MQSFIHKIFPGFIILLTGGIVLALIGGVIWGSRLPKAPEEIVLSEKGEVPPVQVSGECPGARPLIQGKDTFTLLEDTSILLAGNNKPNPKIVEVSLDPLDVMPGMMQTITVKVLYRDTDTITAAYTTSVTYVTDNREETILLKMIYAEEGEGPADIAATWQGAFENGDSHCKTYMAKVTATSTAGENKAELAFR